MTGTTGLLQQFNGKANAPSRWNLLLTLGLMLILTLSVNQVNCVDENVGKTEDVPAAEVIVGGDNVEIGSNRVLPVDAEHKNKLGTPLEAICVQSIRDNLMKFLRRQTRRVARQDDDGDGDDGEEGIAGVIGNLAEGNGALSTLSMIPSVFPQLVSTLTMLSGAVNQGLNGTDTPNLPSFLVKHGQEAVKFFQAIAGAAQSGQMAGPKPSSEIHVQRIPGTNPGVPMRVHAGPPGRLPVYEPYPGQTPVGVVPGSLGAVPIDPEDYIEEDVKQPLQPTLAPLLRPGQFGYDPYGNPSKNSYLQNANLQAAASDVDPNAEGLPQGTSLWNIYKSFRTRPEGVNGTLSDFQLAHPEAFSNELLQSISLAISSIRGHMNKNQQQYQPVPTNKPSSEIFKQFYPANNKTESPPPPSIFQLGNRPTLSVYKPKDTISGVGIDLSNLALNATHTILAGKGPGSNIGKEDEDDVTSLEETTPQPQEELEAPPVGIQRPVKAGTTVIGTGTLEKLQAQNMKQRPKPGGPQFVKSPTSSHLTLQMGTYIPSVVNVHEGEEALQQVGPQTNKEDTKNGISNKSPYTPVLNGILLEAPRLTPSPLYENLKRPSNLVINTEREVVTEQDPKSVTPFPEFHFQVNNARPDLPPNFHGPDPTTRRSTILVAAIPNKFDYDRGQQPIKLGSGLVPQSLFAKPTDAVPESNVETVTEEEAVEPKPEEDIQGAPSAVTPPPLPPPPPPPSPQPQSNANANANKLLQQLLFLQAVLQRQQEIKRQQNIQTAQSALQQIFQDPTTPEPTTVTPPPTPAPTSQQPVEQQNETSQPSALPAHSYQVAPGYLNPGSTPTKTISSSIASGLASALESNLGSSATRVSPNKPLLNNPPSPLATAIGQSVASVTGLSSTDTVDTSKVIAPLRTTTRASTAVVTAPPQVKPTTVPSATRFQQFPSFATGPSSYFPQVVGPVPGKVTGTESGAAQVQTSAKIPDTTATPIAGAFSPYQSFGSFSNHLQSPVQFPPSAAAPNAQQNEPSPLVATSSPSPPQSITTKVEVKTDAPTTIRTTSTSTDLPPLSFINFARPSGGYFPVEVPDIPTGGQPALQPPSYVKSKPAASSDPYSILTNPQFQLQAQSGGYPQYVPTNPVVLVTSSGLVTPTQMTFNSSSPSPPLPNPVNIISEEQSVDSSTSPAPIISAVGSSSSFGQALTSQHQKMSSAIAEMSRLPFYQEDTFRPSAIPPYIIAGGSSSTTPPENPEENSFEEQAESVGTDKPFKELFSSSANVSVDTSPTTSTSAPPPPSPLDNSVPSLSVAEENDSAEEQPYPNFPPGKPVYWMNMYYPNGVPVLMKVTSTTPKPTSPRTRRRRTRSTTTAIPTTPEPEYYEEEEEDDVGQKKARKKKKVASSSSTTEADF